MMMVVPPRITPLSILGAVLVLALMVERGRCIYCWICNSAYDRNCADPFDNITSALVDCSTRHLEHLPNVPATMCRKIVQKVYNDFRYVRDCGYLEKEKEGTECIRRAGTFSVLMKYCSCKTDGCNAAPSTLGTTNLQWVLSVALLVPLCSAVLK
ncbi:UPAR/Ly6 domain-containing protein crok-like [Ornithodoros turicata]|uniref:UPAR/Ly6 domain-containing protein crok-like n=1 Tax=Ornithodoros turicata TaxID=34597 RepID=UPI003138E47D